MKMADGKPELIPAVNCVRHSWLQERRLAKIVSTSHFNLDLREAVSWQLRLVLIDISFVDRTTEKVVSAAL